MPLNPSLTRSLTRELNPSLIRAAGAGGGASDPYWDNVSFLSGFAGADTSTTIVDEGPIGHSPAAVADAQIDTAISKMGGSSLLLDGTLDKVNVPDHASLRLDGDFTIEGFIYYNGDPGTDPRTLCTKWSETGNKREWWLQSQDNVIQFWISTNGTAAALKASDGYDPLDATWFHLAVCRSSNTLYFFADGVAKGNAAMTETLNHDTSPLIIGASEGPFPNNHNGNIDELRVTKGVARYTEGFTVPTEAYPRQ